MNVSACVPTTSLPLGAVQRYVLFSNVPFVMKNSLPAYDRMDTTVPSVGRCCHKATHWDTAL